MALNFGMLFTAFFFFMFGNSAFFMLPIYLTSIGASKTFIGFAMGVTNFTQILTIWLLRNKIDFINKKKISSYASLFAIALYIIFFFFTNIYTVIFLRALQGIILGIGFTFTTSLAIDIIPENKRVGLLALFGIAGAATNFASPMAVELIISYFDFKYVFLMAALSSLLWFAVLFLVKCTKHSHPENELPAEIKEYYKALPSAVMLGFIFSSFFNFISDYLKGMNILPVSIFFQAYTASLILIRIFIIKKMDRWNKKAVITTGFFIGFAGLLTAFGIFYMQNIYMAAIAGMFYGIAHSLLYPTVNSSFIELTPHRKGKANIMFVISFYGGVFLASFIDGIIADFTGYSNMYAIISGVILTFALYLYLKRSQKNRAI